MSVKSRITAAVMPPPAQVRHGEYSMLFSADDEPFGPTPRLIDLSLAAIEYARKVDVSKLGARAKEGVPYLNVWPGEHYKLLPGLVRATGAKNVVEIGTATGLSALTMLMEVPLQGRLTTFDVIPWREYPATVLQDSDFADGRLHQVIADLQDWEIVQKHREVLEAAEFIFIDAAKDGVMEQRFIENLKHLRFKNQPLVMFDDTRVWNMLAIWRHLDRPKLDLTSFGHWSGTGLVDWSA